MDMDPAAFAAGLTRVLPVWLVGATEVVAVVARADCPVGDPDPLGRPKGPHLRDHIVPHLVGSGPAVRGVVTANRPYALSVHQGARPHEIPVGGAATMHARGYPLRFMKDGRVRTPWAVHHPGNAPNPFLRRALVQTIGAM